MGRRKKISKDILSKERQRFYEQLIAGELSLSMASKRMRELINMDQDEFAKLVGVAPRTLKDFESGRGNPTLTTLQKIAKPFGLDVVFKPKGQS
jgi:DNA-binding XRE family transcriptional regulator